MQPSLDIKHFLPYRLNTPSPIGLFPNFNTMDPVQKAVINHTFGVALPPKKKQVISCNVCHLRFNSENQAAAHYKGHKHARKLKALEVLKNKQKQAAAKEEVASPPDHGLEDAMSDPEKTAHGKVTEVCPALIPVEDSPAGKATEEAAGGSVSPRPGSEVLMEEPAAPSSSSASSRSEVACGGLAGGATEAPVAAGAETPASEGSDAGGVTSAPGSEKGGDKPKQQLYCAVCKVTVNSVSQLEAHNNGSKHKSMLEGQNSHNRRNRLKLFPRAVYKTKRIGNKGSVGLQSKAFHCNICEIYVNSETQLKQHMTSRRHKERLTGRASKPKFSPYTKLQQTAALVTKLAFQKHLAKPMAAGFLPNPLTAAAAVCALPNGLTLRPATTLFQTPILGPAFFRAAPGPVRATPASFLFAPY